MSSSGAGFNHIVAAGPDAEHIGPFALGNYLYPTLLLGLPQILLFAGVPFMLGTTTRQAIIVFAFPVVVLLFTLGFLTTWSPSWLSPEANRALMLVDPSGFRWLNETFLKVDRGVEFYNTGQLRPDIGFLISRILFSAAGLVAVAGAARSYANRLHRGGSDSRLARFLPQAPHRRARSRHTRCAHPARPRYGHTAARLLESGACHRPGRSPRTRPAPGHVPFRAPDPLAVHRKRGLRDRRVQFTGSIDIRRYGRTSAQHAHVADLFPFAFLHRRVAAQGAGPPAGRDLQFSPDPYRIHSAGQDRRQQCCGWT